MKIEFITHSPGTPMLHRLKERPISKRRPRKGVQVKSSPSVWGFAAGERLEHSGMQPLTARSRLGIKDRDSAAESSAAPFAAGDSHAGENIETTLGDLIVALTEETHRFVPNERESYELVAYLLSERLTPRRSQALFYRADPPPRVWMQQSDGRKL